MRELNTPIKQMTKVPSASSNKGISISNEDLINILKPFKEEILGCHKFLSDLHSFQFSELKTQYLMYH